jgi:hypothetical protein
MDRLNLGSAPTYTRRREGFNGADVLREAGLGYVRIWMRVWGRSGTSC